MGFFDDFGIIRIIGFFIILVCGIAFSVSFASFFAATPQEQINYYYLYAATGGLFIIGCAMCVGPFVIDRFFR